MLTVFEDFAVQEELDKAKERWSRTDEAWLAITWALARDPTIGEPLTERGHLRAFVYVGAYSYDMPTITVLYDYDRNAINIRSARFENATAGQVGWA